MARAGAANWTRRNCRLSNRCSNATRPFHPSEGRYLLETCQTREGSHLYVYPFEGRFVHEGLGFLFATRLTRLNRGTITVSVNDYGFELLAPRQYPFSNLIEDHIDDLLSSDQLEQDLEQALNLSELCKRRFRSIAQVAGLLVQGFPGQSKSTGQLHISGSLLFDVFSRHEPNNLLLQQARDEVLNEQLELPRLKAALERRPVRSDPLPHTPTRPDGISCWWNGSTGDNESVLERIQRMQAEALKREG